MTTTPTANFRRIPDPAPGVRAYTVTVDGAILGDVTNRRGGWWRATTTAGDTAGSFHSTRKAAAAALIGRVELAEQATTAAVTAPAVGDTITATDVTNGLTYTGRVAELILDPRRPHDRRARLTDTGRSYSNGRPVAPIVYV